MAKTIFNKAVIAADLQLALRKTQVGTSLVNRNFQGQINHVGDTVTIITPQSTTIRDYNPAQDITVDEMDGAGTTLTIDKASYFAFYAHDTEAISEAADAFIAEDVYELADKADAAILKAYTQAGLSVDFDPATGDMLAAVRETKRKMDLANVPSGGRFLALSPFEVEAVEEKLTNRDTGLGDGVVRSGFQGQLYGFNVFQTNNLTETGTADSKVRHGLAGYAGSITYADAIIEVEVMRAEKRFADLCRGLHAYGYAVTRPGTLVDLRLKTGA